MIEWTEILREQAEIAQQLMKSLPSTLSSPNLTEDRAAEIYRMLVDGVHTLSAIFDQMTDDNITSEMYEFADHLESVWDILILDVSNKISSMRAS